MISFSDIIGRRNIIDSIKNDMLHGKLSHAYLLIGQEGVGKKLIAKAMANSILCHSPVEGMPCQKCGHCKSCMADGVTELYEINNEGKSIKVEQIRDIVKSISLQPINGKKKVYLIYDGENMTNQAQNSLLKTLEEPPSYGHIIITVKSTDHILPTILSRSKCINVGINSDEEIAAFLSKHNEKGLDTTMAVKYARGSIGTALQILTSEEFENTRNMSSDYVNALMNKNDQQCFDILKNVDDQIINDFILVTIKLFKDMVVYKETGNDNFLINKDKKYIINNGINKYNSSVLLNVIFILEDANLRLKQNASKKSTVSGMTVAILEELIND